MWLPVVRGFSFNNALMILSFLGWMLIFSPNSKGEEAKRLSHPSIASTSIVKLGNFPAITCSKRKFPAARSNIE